MIEIREANLGDCETIMEFQIAMARETEGIDLDKDTVIKGVKAVFEDKNKGRYYITLSEKKVISCLLTTYEWSDWRNGKIIWIQSLFVSKEYRNQGIFKNMYDFLKGIVEDSEIYKGIRLYVDVSNEKAQKVYQSLGMIGDHYQVYEWMET